MGAVHPEGKTVNAPLTGDLTTSQLYGVLLDAKTGPTDWFSPDLGLHGPKNTHFTQKQSIKPTINRVTLIAALVSKNA